MLKRLPFVPQLDGLRCVAVFLVIISHWVPNNAINKTPNGYLGVTLFFVLSGFLITANLLFDKQQAEKQLIRKKKVVAFFYVRRSLRIFPLYYVVLVLLFLLNRQIFEGKGLWHALYATNFLVFFKQAWLESFSHLWSLAVEEQFYLVWPFLVLFVPQRTIKNFFIGVILFSLLFKIVFYSWMKVPFIEALPFSCFDCFSLGALLAQTMVIEEQRVIGKGALTHIVLNGLFILSLVVAVMGNLVFNYYLFPFYAAYLIAWLYQNRESGLNTLFTIPVVRYLGKISYGLYVYHNFIPWLVRNLKGEETRYPIGMPALLENIPMNTLATEVLQLALLIAIASASWFLFEKPVNNLKKYFN